MNRLPLFILLLLVAGGCATRGEMLAARQDIEELKTRLLVTEKNIRTVKEEAKENIERSSLEALKSLETLRKGTADMQANLDAMRLDVHVMTGKIEDIGLAAKKPFDDKISNQALMKTPQKLRRSARHLKLLQLRKTSTNRLRMP